MDPMEDPDDILRAHRSREKSYLFDVAFDFTATQVRGECGLETHGEKKKLSIHHSARTVLRGRGSSTHFLELCPFVKG